MDYSESHDVEQPQPQPSIEGRPYRSHMRPACFPCRARKSRCQTRNTSVCVLCQAHGTVCVFPQSTARSRRSRDTPRRRNASDAERNATPSLKDQRTRTRCLSSTSPGPPPPQSFTPQSEHHTPNGAMTEFSSPLVVGLNDSISHLIDITAKSHEGSSHVVSPAIADDDRVFQEYLSNTPHGQSRRTVRFQLDLSNPSQYTRSILFQIVPKRGKREVESRSIAASNLEIIDRRIAPYQDDLINLFFEKVNMSFPIFDEPLFRRVYDLDKEKISPGLLSLVYGNTLIFWDTCPRLKNVPCPEIRSVWVYAENAVNAELISTPGISTIISVILNLCGRPSSHHLGNSGHLGMAVALANAFGLNRDPSGWNLSPSEKKFRIRIWWILVIFDRWSSLAYGIPPLIRHANNDVPLPTSEDLHNPGASSTQISAASCFVAFTTLTEVLGHCLEHVYLLGKDLSKMPEASPFNLENLLINWEDSLDDDLRRLVIRGTRLVGSGAANLRLAYLSVKLLIRRSQLDWDRVSLQVKDIDSQYYIQARRVSEEIVDFVRELDESHLRDFWIPLNAYSLTSATTFLMRSALYSRGMAHNAPLKLVRTMINTLQTHRQNYGWDIADNCLSNCTDLVEKIETACEESSSNDLEFEDLVPLDMDMDLAALNGFFPGFTGTF
ncbi:putative Zn(II)2Cys6 transcription factor [Cadophora sp. MPI-SDFR-AT-0126]|nr:putative Zn(II)2Cys6 transcription factor [Leotiomycetes sp. MPI-SDFR-AT-0126]